MDIVSYFSSGVGNVSVTSLLGAIIETFVYMVVGERPSVGNPLPYVNMCDRTDIALNKKYVLSLKVFVVVVVIVVVDIFIGVLNFLFSSNVGITVMWTLSTTSV